MGRIPIPVVPWQIRISLVVIVALYILYWSVLSVPSPEPTFPSPTPETEGTPDTFTLPEWRHFLAYFTLGIALSYALVTRQIPIWMKVVAVVMMAVLYGMFVEVLQGLFTHRSFSTHDMLMNAAGVTVSTSWFILEYAGYPRHIPINRRWPFGH